ncbi:ectonucleotide pyrophosphatase/phosphodiesterase family member 5 [Patella vulgata]|uniref:ectonucleotide pyrophosphatase/phosphodiesterase family member 5 n=1 Tax=Patella vulgata TaxID=6465 RepID=UPI0024A7D721|nr:ectonucleotide pyrophosphatase/phosphodiesterase family member 5 [Patella vulgata]
MDQLLGYMIQKLRNNNLWDSLNVIVTSDHGMTSVDVDNKLVNINDYVPDNTVKMVPRDGAVIQIIPEDGQEDVVFQAIKDKEGEMHVTVYKKKDIPEHYHYKNNRRVTPIVAIAEEGWLIVDKTQKYSKPRPFGGHAYDNRLMSMKPLFLAHGPNFKANYNQESIENVDIYPLICKLLGVNAAPNNGSLSNTEDMLEVNE